MRQFIIATMALFGTLSANIGPQGFKAYPNQYFVETGTYHGAGVRKALEAGFPEIHSLEIDQALAGECQSMFAEFPQVHVWHADSSTQLYEVISDIHAPITFWLDGHNIFPDPNGGKNSPIMEELDQIKRHKIKTHTILIDDRHVMGTVHFDGVTELQIIGKLLEINPQYTISFDIGGDAGNILETLLLLRQNGKISIDNVKKLVQTLRPVFPIFNS